MSLSVVHDAASGSSAGLKANLRGSASGVSGRLLSSSTADVPKYSLREEGMEPACAHRMISDELAMDFSPAHNMASFVTTHMEPEAHELLLATSNINLADQEEYPGSQELQERCVNILADLWHGNVSTPNNRPPLERDDVKKQGEDSDTEAAKANKSAAASSAQQLHTGCVGTSTIGSSEAVMLAALAAKWRWRQWRARKAAEQETQQQEKDKDRAAPSNKEGQKPSKARDAAAASKSSSSGVGSSDATLRAEGWATSPLMHGRSYGPGSDEPSCNLVFSAAVHVSILKACKYLDIQPRIIPLDEGRCVLDPTLVRAQLDHNTIGVVCILGTTLTGEFDPVESVHAMMEEFNTKNGTAISIHVDAASGGFTVPFSHPQLVWDFKLPLVKSINSSGHKFGLVYPGVGWLVFRSRADLPADLIFHVNYLGADEPTYGLNFSKSASPVILQYFQFLRMGRQGYQRVTDVCMANAQHLAESLVKMGIFELYSSNLRPGALTLPLVVARLKPDARLRHLLGFDENDLVHELRTRGWIVPAYALPDRLSHVTVMRIVARESSSREMIELLIDDIKHKAVELMQRHQRMWQHFKAADNKQTNQGNKAAADSAASDADAVVDPDAAARADLAARILASVEPAHPHRRTIGHQKMRGARDLQQHQMQKRVESQTDASHQPAAGSSASSPNLSASHAASKATQKGSNNITAVVC